ncbi:hypothetical protein EXIGLDRAFT_273104 [Exidia glandulosa HHB12029]|uniref:Uncharacterized protein n=1 Tax=Exidia glandulosa HHB12029 TaxID=1314781 RepID=A0A165DL15_EXIGL|nr:hypothetical protein EXIGLDRAFT_273104 [Exidia glandulosa HHB12029]
MNTGSFIPLPHHPASPCVRSPLTGRTCRRSQSILIHASPRRACCSGVDDLAATGPSLRLNWTSRSRPRSRRNTLYLGLHSRSLIAAAPRRVCWSCDGEQLADYGDLRGLEARLGRPAAPSGVCCRV